MAWFSLSTVMKLLIHPAQYLAYGLAVILLTSVTTVGEGTASTPSSPEELRQAVETAYRDHDLDALYDVVCWDGTDAYSRGETEDLFRSGIRQEVKSVHFKGLTGNEREQFTTPEGVTYRWNIELVGSIDISFMPGVSHHGFAAGKKGDTYLIAMWAPVDTLPSPEDDPILSEKQLTSSERKWLDDYYEGSISVWDFLKRTIWDLNHPHPTLQLRGQRLLLLVLEDALEVEQVEDAPSTLFSRRWSRRAQRARSLRKDLYLGDELSEAVLPIAKFFCDQETWPEAQLKCTEILAEVSGASAERAILDLIERPRPNARLTTEALELAHKLGLSPSQETLRPLTQHYRPSISTSARKLNDALGYPPAEPLDLDRSIQSEGMRDVISRVDSLFPQTAGVDAEYVRLVGKEKEARFPWGEAVFPWQWDGGGWLEREGPDSVTIIFGIRRTIPKVDTFYDGHGNLQTRAITVEQVPIEEEVRRLEQEDGFGFGRLVFGQWLLKRGDREKAGRLLVPLLDSHTTDEEFIAFVRESMGGLMGYEMLKSFAGERDYSSAQRLAMIVTKKYPDTYFSGAATDLVEQIPKRLSDFNEFVLPTPDEWAELKQTLPRDDQIRFLCEHLRLLNWYGYGGSRWDFVGAYDKQYAEANGVQNKSSFPVTKERLRPGETLVINPFLILAGATIADISVMAPYLLEDWLTLGVNDGSTTKTFNVLMDAINLHIADEVVVSPHQWGSLTRQEKEKMVAHAINWAETNKHLTEQERVLNHVLRAKKWLQVPFHRLDKLTEEQQRDLVPFYLSFLDGEGVKDYERMSILTKCYELSPEAGVSEAAEYLDYPKQLNVQTYAGLILYKAGAKRSGANAIYKALDNGTRETLYLSAAHDGVKALLESGEDAEYERARVIFDRDYFDGAFSELGPVLRTFAEAGRPDAYSWLIKELADSTDFGGTSGGPLQRRDWAALAAVEYLEGGGQLKYKFNDPPEIRALDRKRIQGWLKEQLAGAERQRQQ